MLDDLAVAADARDEPLDPFDRAGDFALAFGFELELRRLLLTTGPRFAEGDRRFDERLTRVFLS